MTERNCGKIIGDQEDEEAWGKGADTVEAVDVVLSNWNFIRNINKG